MMMVDSRYAEQFHALFQFEGLTGPALLSGVQVYEEFPVYSRYAQLEFMAGLSFAGVNRELIRASVALLEGITADCGSLEGGDRREHLLCMISVTDWHSFDEDGRSICNDGSIYYIVPHIWVGNLRNDLMRAYDVCASEFPPALRPPGSQCADFVASALDHAEDYTIYQSPEYDWCPERVYVRLAHQRVSR